MGPWWKSWFSRSTSGPTGRSEDELEVILSPDIRHRLWNSLVVERLVRQEPERFLVFCDAVLEDGTFVKDR